MKHRKLEKKNKEESSLQQKKASLTVESAFILPLFFLVVVVITGMLDLYRISALIQTAMCEGAKELGMYAYCGPEDHNSPVGVVQDGICVAYGTRKIRECLQAERLSGIQGGVNGITLLGSGYSNDMVSLKASFSYKIPSGLFQLFPVRISVKSQARAWTGFHGTLHGNSEDCEMVYVTDWESVYHTSPTCTHLDLSVEKVSLEQAQADRNQYGSSYHPCENCIGQGSANDSVYITQHGTAYHNDVHCGGIKRTVKMVKKSETGAFHACERCGGGS